VNKKLLEGKDIRELKKIVKELDKKLDEQEYTRVRLLEEYHQSCRGRINLQRSKRQVKFWIGKKKAGGCPVLETLVNPTQRWDRKAKQYYSKNTKSFRCKLSGYNWGMSNYQLYGSHCSKCTYTKSQKYTALLSRKIQ
jgi:hypothetical protein